MQFKLNFALLACLLAALTLGLPGPGGALEAGQGLMVEVNGREIKTDVPPLLVRDQVMVPVRAVAEAFGAWVEWDSQKKRVLVNSPWAPPDDGGPGISLWVDSKEIKPDVPPKMVNGRVLVPLRWVTEALG